ncbi:MAG TPA: J domain-containing protein [Candidatus Eremiobacteraceae bacterium]
MPGTELSYYDLLGLKPDASHDEICAAYNSLIVRIRPNVAHDSASTIRLAAAVKEAWETLGDEDKRHVYDEGLRGTAAYGEIWKRSQQSTYIEERNKWFDQQVRRAQSDRQAAYELQAERKQLEEDYSAAVATKNAADLAREALVRAAAAKTPPASDTAAGPLRWLAVAAVLVVLIAAGVLARGLIGRYNAAPASNRTSAPVAGATNAAAPLPAAGRAMHKNSPLPGLIATALAHALGSSNTSAPERQATSAASSPPVSSPALTRTQVVAKTGVPPHRSAIPRPSYACKTVAIATVTRDGSTVDLSDGSRYQLTDPVDRAQAEGWATGTAVAKCAWPAGLKRPASLDVNGYTVRTQSAAIVASTVSTLSSAAPGEACADASITDVSDDGYGVGLSDGHAYAVDIAGHVTAASWLVGDAVSVCATPKRGATAYTVARSGVTVNASRSQSVAAAARAPTLCVVRLVSRLADDGSQVVFNDGHTYRIDSVPGRTIVAGWSLSERVTVCIRLASGTVYATLAHGPLTAHAVRID